jgi:hypothetical protein
MVLSEGSLQEACFDARVTLSCFLSLVPDPNLQSEKTVRYTKRPYHVPTLCKLRIEQQFLFPVGYCW